ncbi:TadE/TadG family type IV pilus assembly protein [Sphingomonas parva]|uniref:TadE/TadG family type IV pilus assembly protein n=1 Tax=Sphingomonas parva TaxID=2555898 RepID=UPI00143150C1|nr:TadE/TadG family type IV pilus assembly protein [Sphingomonas parva]
MNASFLRRLRGDQRGTSVIELAIIAPVLSLVTMGIIDLSTGYSRRLELTEAVDRTIERISAGDFAIPGDATGPNYDAFVADAAAAAKVPEEAVSVSAWRECDGIEQSDFEGTCPKKTKAGCEVETPPDNLDCFQITARYIQVSIDSAFKPMFTSIFAPGPNGAYPLHVEAAVRIQ